MTGADLLDVVHADLVVVWGANPAISNTHFPPLVNQARRRGAALVVVDPRRTAMAGRADLHLALRPGTDVVLALAVAGRARPPGPGRPGLHRRPCRPGSTSTSRPAGPGRWSGPPRCAGSDRAEIAALVDLVGSRRPAFWRPGWGIERNRNGGSAVRAVLALPVLTGAFGRLGSGVHLTPSTTSPGTTTGCAGPCSGRPRPTGRRPRSGRAAT